MGRSDGIRLDDDARRCLVDSFREDMAEVQRSKGQLPDSQGNDTAIQALGERFEHLVAAEQRRSPGPGTAPRTQDMDAPSMRGKGAWRPLTGREVLERQKRPGLHARMHPRSVIIARMWIARVNRLLALDEPVSATPGAPTWRHRAMQVMCTFVDAKRGKLPAMAAHRALRDLIEESERLFGPDYGEIARDPRVVYSTPREDPRRHSLRRSISGSLAPSVTAADGS